MTAKGFIAAANYTKKVENIDCMPDILHTLQWVARYAPKKLSFP